MKLCTKSIIINPQFPIKQIGFIHQIDEINEVHDDLHARFLFIEDDFIFIHVSVDALGFSISFQEELEKKLNSYFKKIVHIVVSATHTHFGGDTYNPKYYNQLMESFYTAIIYMEPVEYGFLEISYTSTPFEKVGKSRLTSHTAIPILSTIEIKNSKKRLATIINYNCHPTILSGENTKFFSGEFPGYLINKLNEKYPNEFFTYISGAMGDISTRFTRKDQTYNSVITLGNYIYDEVVKLLTIDKKSYSINLSFCSHTIVPIHELTNKTLETSNLTAREIETINFGKIIRSKIKIEELYKKIVLSKISLGKISIIFAPNELFSSYLDAINTNNTVLACYSNGYHPYVLGLNDNLICYEMFSDTLSIATKMEIYNKLAEWSNGENK